MGSVHVRRPKRAAVFSPRGAPRAARSFRPRLHGDLQNRGDDDAKSTPKALAAIRKRADFLAMRGSARANTPGFLLLARKNPENADAMRFGLTVTKKLGGAVRRNRMRRRLRAAVHAVLPEHGARGYDYVLVARGAANDRNFNALLDDLKRALLRLARNSI